MKVCILEPLSQSLIDNVPYAFARMALHTRLGVPGSYARRCRIHQDDVHHPTEEGEYQADLVYVQGHRAADSAMLPLVRASRRDGEMQSGPHQGLRLGGRPGCAFRIGRRAVRSYAVQRLLCPNLQVRSLS